LIEKLYVNNEFECFISQTAEYVRFRRDLGGGKLKNLGAGAQKCPRAVIAETGATAA
jgi:hypothetical protein